MNIYSPVISGSLTVTGSTNFLGNVVMSGSLTFLSGSLTGTASNSDLLSGTGSVGFTTTGSFATMSGSVSSRVSQIETVYATTGSNSFRATQSITGSLTVTGQIIAQTLNVQQVTSSIVYSSGSNVFGCDVNSRQTFTGSFYQTGSTAIFSNRVCSFLGNFTCLGVGTTCLRDTFVVSGNGGAVLERFTGVDPYSGDLYFYSARGTSSSPTTKCNGDVAMGIRPRAYDGTSYLDVAAIESKIDGAISTNVMCGNLIFSTNGGGTTLTERMRITSCGKIGIGSNNPTYLLDIAAGTNGNFSTPAVRISTSTGGAGGATILQINHTANSVSGLQIAEYGAAPGNYASIINTENSYMIFGTNNTERMKIECDGVAELKQYWKIGTGINSTCYLGVSENQVWRTGGGILYINSSGTGNVSIANGGGSVGIGIASLSSGGVFETKHAGVANTNSYFGTGQVRIGGNADHSSNTVLSVAPGVVTFDRPGVGGGALTINSSGYMTLPSQPSFTAVSNSGQQDYTSGQVIVFNLTRYNTSGNYNTSNGRFTAPVTGKYLFALNVYTYTSYAVAITLAINGSQYVPSDVIPLIYKPSEGVSSNLSFTILLDLSANDYVEVRSRAGYTSRIYMSHSNFSGQLIS